MKTLLAALAMLWLVTATVAAAPFDALQAAGIDQKPGAQIPLDVTFRDAKGHTTTLRQLAGGRPLLLAPVLHRCPNICGITLEGLARAVMALPAGERAKVAVVAFGIDPREGPSDAQATRDALHVSHPQLTGLHALTGTAEHVRDVTRALGYRYAWDERIGQYDHVAATAVLTADGRLARWLYGLTPEPTDLRLALAEAGRGRIGSFADQFLLLCYHYDPQTGRYAAWVPDLLRWTGALTMLALAGAIARALLKERAA